MRNRVADDDRRARSGHFRTVRTDGVFRRGSRTVDARQEDPMNITPKRPWLLVFVNAGALMSAMYQMHHLVLMLGAR
jgi:hypothetical protein